MTVAVELRSPSRLGRYEIIGRLAAGGMAEILLARLRGPHGFERPVAVKRILPHLAAQKGVIDMFLDEARVIASLRHPNLIHVHELAGEDSELFIAMEYLEGEPVSGLSRRLASRGEQLDFVLAAHIVGEACAGLHAAHEARDDSGRPLEIIHRDVSPQNIFVGYSGAVHVIDFGIASSVDRIARTDAGTVRGKMEYLAPEQVSGVPCDRRVDVFALGVVLFELASGHRLFKRASPVETALAVMSDEAPPPLSVFRPDAPARLAEICARALSRDRRHRFVSAADMRRELLAFVRERTHDDMGEVLGRRMTALFPDRIVEKTEMLRRAGNGDAIAQVPSVEVDLAVELPTVAQHHTVLSQVSEPRIEETSSGRHRLVGSVALVILATAVAGSVGLLRARAAPHEPPSPPPTAVPPLPLLTQLTPSEAPVQGQDATKSAAHLHVDSTPAGATVRVDGVAAGMTPCDLTLTSGRAVHLELRARGHRAAARQVTLDADATIHLDLVPLAGRPAAAARPMPASAPARPSPTLWE